MPRQKKEKTNPPRRQLCLMEKSNQKFGNLVNSAYDKSNLVKF
jgi:hypothetical protein